MANPFPVQLTEGMTPEQIRAAGFRLVNAGSQERADEITPPMYRYQDDYGNIYDLVDPTNPASGVNFAAGPRQYVNDNREFLRNTALMLALAGGAGYGIAASAGGGAAAGGVGAAGTGAAGAGTAAAGTGAAGAGAGTAAAGTAATGAVGAAGSGGAGTAAGMGTTIANWLANNPGLVQAGLSGIGGVMDWDAIGRAAAAQEAALDAARNDVVGGYDAAAGQIGSSFDQAMGAIDGGYNTAVGSVNSGYETARGDIRDAYEQSRSDLAPFRDAGIRAQAELESRMPELTRRFTGADLYDDPGFQFELEQARKAIGAQMAASGLSLSGGAMRDLSNYSQGLASTRFNEAFGRDLTERQSIYNMFDNQIGRGAGAAGQMSAAANQFGTNMGSLATGRSNALANLATGRGSSIANLTTGRGTSLANLAIGRGSNLADIASNRGNVTAAAIIGRNNALTGAIGSGVDAWQQQSMIDLLRRAYGSNNVSQ